MNHLEAVSFLWFEQIHTRKERGEKQKKATKSGYRIQEIEMKNETENFLLRYQKSSQNLVETAS